MTAHLIVSGLVFGAYYALAGLGLVIVYSSSRVVNFAQGDLATLSAFVGFTLFVQRHMPYPLAFVAATACGMLTGLVMERTIVRGLRGRSVLTVIVATLAVAMIINGGVQLVWGGDVQPMQPPLDGVATLGAFTISQNELLTVSLAIALIAALACFFRFSRYGVAMLAASQNRTAAQLIGIPVERLSMFSWTLSGALGGIAGLLLAPVIFLSPTTIDQVLITAFAVVVLGGFTSIPGAIVGGLIVGLFDSFFSAFVSSNLKATAIFALILAILIVRPQGIFGRRSSVRV